MEVKAYPFKIADDQTLITSIIEKNNFTNESLHVIGQQQIGRASCRERVFALV